SSSRGAPEARMGSPAAQSGTERKGGWVPPHLRGGDERSRERVGSAREEKPAEKPVERKGGYVPPHLRK
ncbi:hypothetical protein LTS18_004132, partial [Coniosporium uncinatum]